MGKQPRIQYNTILTDLISEERKAELDKILREMIQADQLLEACRNGQATLQERISIRPKVKTLGLFLLCIRRCPLNIMSEIRHLDCVWNDPRRGRGYSSDYP